MLPASTPFLAGLGVRLTDRRSQPSDSSVVIDLLRIWHALCSNHSRTTVDAGSGNDERIHSPNDGLVSAADVNCTGMADEICTLLQAGGSVTVPGAADVREGATSAVTSLLGAGPEQGGDRPGSGRRAANGLPLDRHRQLDRVNRPGFPEAPVVDSGGHRLSLVESMIFQFVLGRRHVADRFE